MENATVASPAETKVKSRVYGFVDGFNLYHALEDFRHARTDEDRRKYQKYKWLCLSSLLKRYIEPQTDELVGVEYFTTYPTWDTDKKLRHSIYVSALISQGVHVTFGEFKLKTIGCRATCKQEFQVHEEKQTDVNISTALIALADSYDKAILLTEDSDQVPAVRLLKKLHPEKRVLTFPPIGRNSKELVRVCDGRLTMSEDALIACQLPNPIPIIKGGKQSAVLVKPSTW
jgi:uncharacterized LabA/DUF88 family protein